jgi:hypothetical protein
MRQKKASKIYFSVASWGTLLIPIDMIEEISARCLVAKTDYNSKTNSTDIKTVESITEIKIWPDSDIAIAQCQSALEGK